jgi:hypothetical protein
MWVNTLHGLDASVSNRHEVAKVHAPSEGTTEDNAPPIKRSPSVKVISTKNTTTFNHTKRVSMPPWAQIIFAFSNMIQ